MTTKPSDFLDRWLPVIVTGLSAASINCIIAGVAYGKLDGGLSAEVKAREAAVISVQMIIDTRAKARDMQMASDKERWVQEIEDLKHNQEETNRKIDVLLTRK